MGYPVSAVCPGCGGTAYHPVSPGRLVAYQRDRVCRSCQTRYTPPTPVAAAVAFVVGGLVAAGLALSSFLDVGAFVLSRGVDMQLRPTESTINVVLLVMWAVAGVAGALAIIYGLRALIWRGKV